MDELTAAKAERQRLRAELAAIAAKRAKAGEPVAALKRAEGGAAKVAHDAAVSKWIHGGSLGRRPQPEDVMNGHTPPEFLAARRAAADALPALERLDAEARGIHKEFDSACAAVVDLAAKQMAADFEALATRAHELRQELAEIEGELAAGYHYFSEASDAVYAGTGQRNPALLLPKEAALAGLDEETASIRNVPMPNRQMLAKYREAFVQLQEG